MSIIVRIGKFKFSWCPAERGIFVLRKCYSRKHPKVVWHEWHPLFGNVVTPLGMTTKATP